MRKRSNKRRRTYETDRRDERIARLADMFRWSYEEWKRLTPKDRATVSIRARLNLGNIGRRS